MMCEACITGGKSIGGIYADCQLDPWPSAGRMLTEIPASGKISAVIFTAAQIRGHDGIGRHARFR